MSPRVKALTGHTPSPPEVAHWDPRGGRRELASTSCYLASIVCYCTFVHTYSGAMVMHTFNPSGDRVGIA